MPTSSSAASVARRRCGLGGRAWRSSSIADSAVGAGHAIGVIRIVRPETAAVELVADEASVLVGLAIDDVRDILEEDPAALVAIADRLAALLLDDAP